MNLDKRDFRVGLFVLTMLGVFIATLVYVNKARFAAKTYSLKIRLPGIAGIDRGVEVMYRGYKAGVVDAVEIGYKPDVHFVVTLAIKEEIRLRSGI